MNLRRLILVLTLCSALLPLPNTFYAGYTVQRQQLIDTTQESNAAYARKLAQSTDDFLQSALQQLGYTAQLLADHMGDEPMLTQEATRLRLQTKRFNSVTIYNPQAIVLATSPEALQIKGRMLDSAAVQESLRTRSTVISQAYMSAAGNLIVFISHPIFSPSGEYLGAVGGSIYLKQESMLNRLLGTHFYADGSYLYVVDKSKRIIYHPNPDRVGQVITGNTVIDRVISGDSGYAAVNNSQGTANAGRLCPSAQALAGASSHSSQQATLAPLDTLMRTMLYKTLPLTCVLLLVIWWGSRRIAQPLRQLANGAHTMDRAADTAANYLIGAIVVLRSARAEKSHAGWPGPAAQEHEPAAPRRLDRSLDGAGQPPPHRCGFGPLCKPGHSVCGGGDRYRPLQARE